ncbi:MAG: hypothetical protein RJA33_1162 [Actinomycetota bacterium]|jgi:hypothetical protein
MRKRPLIAGALATTLLLSACGGSSSSYGDACPLLQIYANDMAMVISSVPVAVEYDQRRENLIRALSMTSFTDLQSLKLAFNANLNSALKLSDSVEAPSGDAKKVVEDLRLNVWEWDWTTVSTLEEVDAIMEGFAAIEQGCTN